MIDILTGPLAQDCLALKTALQHEGIEFRELDINALSPEEHGELEAQARNKLLYMRYSGKEIGMEQILCTPIVRLYSQGQPCFLFPVDLLDHGIARVEALAGIKAMMK
ncbi:MAG: hypothetical protein ACYDG4_15160 [Desulfuromonadaceae bacterium]